MRRWNRRAARGLTLIEVMVIVAVVALLMTVLIFYLLGDDDRRCRLEAERLAAFLTAASAESVMNDGPTRVAFNIEPQTCVRELARLEAGVSGGSWKVDEAADPFNVRKPVRMSELVNTHGTISAGTGWMVFGQRRTQGGVVILTVNEAVWSVVVPNDKSEIHTKRGRVNMPPPAPLLASLGRQPLPPLPEFKPGELPSFPSGAPASSSGGNAAPKSTTPKPTTPKTTSDPEPEPTLEPEPVVEPEPTATPDPTPPMEPEIEEPEEEEEEEEEEPECRTDSDCGSSRYHRCFEGECKIDINGEAFRINRVTVGEPADLAPFIQEVFNQQISTFKYNLVVKLDQNYSGRPGVEENRAAWIAQAEGAGSTGEVSVFRPMPELPSFRGTASPMSCNLGHDICFRVMPESGHLNLYLPLPTAEANAARDRGACAYQPLSVIASMQVYIKLQGNELLADMSLTGVITEEMAAELRIVYEGNTIRLEQLFEMNGIRPDTDNNGDHQPDAWQLNFEGSSYRVSLLGNLYDALGRVPANCPSF